MIKIFQRHCNFSTNSEHKPRPEWFNREKIFDSLINTLDNRVEYTAFHDSGNGDIKDHFLSNEFKIFIHEGGVPKKIIFILSRINLKVLLIL